MNLQVPDDINTFFKQVWKILGIESVLKSDLIYKISYKLNLPYKPTSIVKKIKEAVSQGILKENNKILSLNEKDMKEITREQQILRKTVQKPLLQSWNRIEDSHDPWMNSLEKKIQSGDKKSISLNAIIKKIMSKEVLSMGMDIAAAKIHPEIQNDVIHGSVEDESGVIFKIDFSNKIIIHNCTDFIATIPQKQLCKHFYRIFMNVKRKDTALTQNVLYSLYTKKDEWTFKQS